MRSLLVLLAVAAATAGCGSPLGDNDAGHVGRVDSFVSVERADPTPYDGPRAIDLDETTIGATFGKLTTPGQSTAYTPEIPRSDVGTRRLAFLTRACPGGEAALVVVDGVFELHVEGQVPECVVQNEYLAVVEVERSVDARLPD